MAKRIFVGFVLGVILTYNKVRAGGFFHDIQELDQLHLTASWDVDRPGQLPVTPHGIFKSWPFLHRSVRNQDLVDSAFADNPVFLILFRIGEITKINMVTKFCYNDQAVERVAHFNRATNRIIPTLIPWYKLTLNTYLDAAHPYSPVDAGELICLMKKLMHRLIMIVPPKIQQGIFKYLVILQERQSGLGAIILRHLNINLEDNGCSLVHHPVANPLGIKSHDVALMLAWNRVLKSYLRPA